MKYSAANNKMMIHLNKLSMKRRELDNQLLSLKPDNLKCQILNEKIKEFDIQIMTAVDLIDMAVRCDGYRIRKQSDLYDLVELEY